MAKDAWDKLSASAGLLTFVSSIVIAVVGGAFTLVYKGTEDRRAELDVSEKMLVHLVKGGSEARGSLALMTSLSRCDVATQMAAVFGTPDVIESLRRLASTTKDVTCRTLALAALEKLASQGTVEEARAAVAARAAAQSVVSLSSESSTQDFIVSSGPKPSGAMKNFSDWYELCADAPPGFRILKSDFRLVGDRTCGAWAECTQSLTSDQRTCWRFRLQGHDEAPPPGIRETEGVLHVSAKKLGQ